MGQIASDFGLPVPPDLRRNKGWIGQVMEEVLGATAASRAEPDFPHLAVELKTLPVESSGRVRESTYVCTAPLTSVGDSWENSWVCHKLACVLWVPIVSVSGTPPGERVVGTPLLWRPSEEQRRQLERDWHELTQLMRRGELWMISGHRGEALQLRPKAANASSTQWVLDEDANWVQEIPFGFYLRASFTRELLSRHFYMRDG